MKEKRKETFSQDICYSEKLIIQNSLNSPSIWTLLSHVCINYKDRGRKGHDLMVWYIMIKEKLNFKIYFKYLLHAKIFIFSFISFMQSLCFWMYLLAYLRFHFSSVYTSRRNRFCLLPVVFLTSRTALFLHHTYLYIFDFILSSMNKIG